MPVDLSSNEWANVTSAGQLIGPDVVRYVRRTTKTQRRTCEELVQGGAPLVLYYWAGGQLDWFEGDEAAEQWRSVRSSVISHEPRRTGGLEWMGGIWESDEGKSLVLLTGHC